MAEKTGKTTVNSLEATDLGKYGEKLAIDYLKEIGLSLIEHDYRTQYGEIDLIMRDGDVLVFVEVKLRIAGSLVTADSALTRKQIKRIARAAMYYLGNVVGQEVDCRFDLITIDFKDGFYKLTHTKSLVPLGEYLS